MLMPLCHFRPSRPRPCSLPHIFGGLQGTSPVLGTEDTALNEADEHPCPHGACGLEGKRRPNGWNNESVMAAVYQSSIVTVVPPDKQPPSSGA